MKAYIEHMNITVPKLDNTLNLLKIALPDWWVRGGGDTGRKKWVHFGDDDFYLSLGECPENEGMPLFTTDHHHLGLGHTAIVVEDVESVVERLTQAGYVESSDKESTKARERRYFLDDNNLEWEFVEYRTADPSIKNAYL